MTMRTIPRIHDMLSGQSAARTGVAELRDGNVAMAFLHQVIAGECEGGPRVGGSLRARWQVEDGKLVAHWSRQKP
jgi:hypothetical protein